MSYAQSADLQTAVYETLMEDTSLQSILGPHIYDGFPPGTVPPLYASIGAEIVRDASDKTGSGTVHELFMSVVSADAGFKEAKRTAAAITTVLHEKPLTLPRGRVVSIRFTRAVAKRENKARLRRIDMTFRARLEDD